MSAYCYYIEFTTNQRLQNHTIQNIFYDAYHVYVFCKNYQMTDCQQILKKKKAIISPEQFNAER